MCVVSMVHDHFGKQFDDWQRKYAPPVTAPNTFTFTPAPDLTELKELIKEFRELVAAAKRIDTVTGQPDCVDPEKAKLEDRVSALEAKMTKLTEALGG